MQLQNIEGDYLGSVTIGFTKKIIEKLLSGILPIAVKVKSRGWTSGGWETTHTSNNQVRMNVIMAESRTLYSP